MTLLDHIKQSRTTKLVPETKFNRHMKKARVQDIASRKSIFCQQSEKTIERNERNRNIEPQTY